MGASKSKFGAFGVVAAGAGTIDLIGMAKEHGNEVAEGIRELG